MVQYETTLPFGTAVWTHTQSGQQLTRKQTPPSVYKRSKVKQQRVSSIHPSIPPSKLGSLGGRPQRCHKTTQDNTRQPRQGEARQDTSSQARRRGGEGEDNRQEVVSLTSSRHFVTSSQRHHSGKGRRPRIPWRRCDRQQPANTTKERRNDDDNDNDANDDNDDVGWLAPTAAAAIRLPISVYCIVGFCGDHYFGLQCINASEVMECVMQCKCTVC